MEKIEQIIGYEFKDKSLLERALTTPAYRMSNPKAKDNQRLEFLGDAVFGLLSAEAVFDAHPDEQEGPLTVRRTHLVSTAALTFAAEKLELGEYLKRNVGAGALVRHAKAQADALEALMGAIWLDGGLDAAKAFFGRLELPAEGPLREWESNPKGALQVKAQAMEGHPLPVYEVLSVKGPGHAPIVTVRVTVAGFGSAVATEVSKSAAEVAAASRLMELMK